MENPKMQIALFVKEIGKPVVLGLRPVPSPTEGQLLIKITSTMILPHDTYSRDVGLFIGHKLPNILGTNVAGIVQSFGPDTFHRYPVGSHIFGQADVNFSTPDEAGLQKYAVLDITATAPVPATLTDDKVVTLPVNAVTSFIALFHPTSGFGFPDPLIEKSEENSTGSEVSTFQTLVIIGAGTHVGRLAIGFAKLAGVARVIAIASISRMQELEGLGATYVIDRHLPVSEITAQVHSAAGGAENVTRVYDCSSWTFELGIALLSPNASLFLALHPIDKETEAMIKKKRPMCKAKFVTGISKGLGAMEDRFWKQLPFWAEKGFLAFSEVRFVEGLDECRVNEALDGYRDGSGGRGVVVHPHRAKVEMFHPVQSVRSVLVEDEKSY